MLYHLEWRELDHLIEVLLDVLQSQDLISSGDLSLVLYLFQQYSTAGVQKAMAYVDVMVDIKDPLLLTEKGNPWSGSSGFHGS